MHGKGRTHSYIESWKLSSALLVQFSYILQLLYKLRYIGLLCVVSSLLYLAHDKIDQYFRRTRGRNACVLCSAGMYVYISHYRLYLVVFSVEDSFGASSVTRLEEEW